MGVAQTAGDGACIGVPPYRAREAGGNVLHPGTVCMRGCSGQHWQLLTPSSAFTACPHRQVEVCAWELVGPPPFSGARVRPNAVAWDDLGKVLALANTDAGNSADSVADGSHAHDSGGGPGRRLAEGLLDWQQLQLIVAVGPGCLAEIHVCEVCRPICGCQTSTWLGMPT